jgi:ABC-type nitrate/sulfonate/bicarbonate transport system permease component
VTAVNVDPQPTPVVPLSNRTLQAFRDWAPALVVLAAFIGLWEAIVKGFHVQRFLLPAPDAIWTAFVDNQSTLWHAGWFTFQ